MPVNPAAAIANSLPPHMLRATPYPGELPDELAPWHTYTLDGGHSIVVVLDHGLPDPAVPDRDFPGQLVPAPVRQVLREGYRIVDGWVVSQLDYQPDFGLVCGMDDEEF